MALIDEMLRAKQYAWARTVLEAMKASILTQGVHDEAQQVIDIAVGKRFK